MYLVSPINDGIPDPRTSGIGVATPGTYFLTVIRAHRSCRCIVEQCRIGVDCYPAIPNNTSIGGYGREWKHGTNRNSIAIVAPEVAQTAFISVTILWPYVSAMYSLCRKIDDTNLSPKVMRLSKVGRFQLVPAADDEPPRAWTADIILPRARELKRKDLVMTIFEVLLPKMECWKRCNPSQGGTWTSEIAMSLLISHSRYTNSTSVHRPSPAYVAMIMTRSKIDGAANNF
jgi:hypothetical protein